MAGSKLAQYLTDELDIRHLGQLHYFPGIEVAFLWCILLKAFSYANDRTPLMYSMNSERKILGQ